MFQATQYDIDSSRIPQGVTGDALSSLQHDLSGPKVAVLADGAASSQGSLMLKQINNALNAWRITWDLRYYRDIAHENHSFSADPSPLWYLAKLYIVLHVHVPPAGEGNEFVCSRVKGIDEREKIAVQSKIIRWLSRFRGQHGCSDSLQDNILPRLMRPHSVDSR